MNENGAMTDSLSPSTSSSGRQPLRIPAVVLCLLLAGALFAAGGRAEAQTAGPSPDRIDSRSVDRSSGREAVDRDLSMLYTRYAAEQLQEGMSARAAELASTALLFESENPDALYLVGRKALEDGRPERAGELLSTALSSNAWRFFSPREVRVDLAQALFRQGKTKDAYLLLSPYYASNMSNSAEFLLLFSRLLEAMDKREMLAEMLQEAAERYPEHAELQALRISLDEEYAEQVLVRVLEGDEAQRYGRETYEELISRSSGKERGKLLTRYESRWSENRFSRLYRLLEAEEITSEKVSTFFSSFDTLSGSELERLAKAAGETEATDAFQEGFSAFTGTVEYDRDGNGTVERYERFVEGVPEELRIDRSTDSGYDYLVQYSDGEPDRFTARGGNGENRVVEMSYGEYPKVREVRWQHDEELLEIRLVPYEYRFPIFTGEGEDGTVSEAPYRMADLREEIRMPDSAQLLPHASRIERRESNELAARFIRSTGTAEFGIDEASYNRVARYAGAELERRDITYRGEDSTRITEWYRDGELKTLTYDGNGNGTPELIEHHGRKILQMWDFDEDGAIDYETTITHTGDE
jgi:hypothetical protein